VENLTSDTEFSAEDPFDERTMLDVYISMEPDIFEQMAA
jgi:hypothetical protein